MSKSKRKIDPKHVQRMAARIAACIEHAEREHTEHEVEAAARALGLDQRWPPVQQELLAAA